ncbi:hypothetical protein VSS74_01495 [Conexibacter stalactiti]|uniref:Uncharacterized protein n=1 Tax=Conexibacter stalactiti TaxID=1940611 RepID=A0ABU4HI95_9ACTN|nr:hypothetical protein [Conexibacter stalactiti]MDW5592992.1 hypothetical protein [Conexibacter stalactiti]MEC5033633.1 hypothetical protein [Conexibacter stalactiti]
MALTLKWMQAHAPYMPIATAGLLALLEGAGEEAAARWEVDRAGRAALQIETNLDADGVAAVIADAPWPDESRVDWPGGSRNGAQALKPLLKATGQPLQTFRDMVAAAPELEAATLRAIVTDGVLDSEGLPARSRLLRGVKSDLTSAFKPPRRFAGDEFAAELRDGLTFRTDAKGLGLGLVPEVQTFGGTTGPDPASIDAYSPLLHALIWNGIVALPPVPVMRGRTRMVGGPLASGSDVLSWPRWRVAVGLSGLRTLFSLAEVHADEPDLTHLSRRGIDRVYRARAIPLNNMIAVYRWGEEIAAGAGRR